MATTVPARKHKFDKYLFTDEDWLILYYRTDPVQGAIDLLCLDGLNTFQRIALKELWFKPYCYLLMGRGMGKTWAFAVLATLGCMLYPNLIVEVVAKTFRQAKFIMREVQRLYLRSPYIQASTTIMRTKGVAYGADRAHLTFDNGSYIEALPMGNDGAAVRGTRAHWVLVDEIPYFDINTMNTVIRPFAIVELPGYRNKFHMAGTAFFKWNHAWTEYLYHHIMKEKSPDDFGLLEFDPDDVFFDQEQGRELFFGYSETELAHARVNMSDDLFMCEYYNRFPSEDTGFITWQMIAGCTPTKEDKALQVSEDGVPLELTGYLANGHPKADYFMGLDPARVGGKDSANCSYTVVKHVGNNVLQVVYQFTVNGETFPVMAGHVRRLLNAFPIIRVNIDARGGGTALRDLLQVGYVDEDGKEKPPILEVDSKAAGKRILYLVNPTEIKNTEMATRVQAKMEDRSLLFPIDTYDSFNPSIRAVCEEVRALKIEMANIVATPKGAVYKFDHDAKYRKDRFDSLLLACDAANDHLAVPDEKKLGNIPLGFWVGKP